MSFPGGATGKEPACQYRRLKKHVQGAVAAWAQEGLEELSHTEGQEGQW